MDCTGNAHLKLTDSITDQTLPPAKEVGNDAMFIRCINVDDIQCSCGILE